MAAKVAFPCPYCILSRTDSAAVTAARLGKTVSKKVVAGGFKRTLVRNCIASTTSAVSKGSESWSKFAKNVSGEWSGCAADFDKNGKPLELPSSLVPEAYREWGVEVFDWETYCATLAQEGTQSFYNKTLRLFPTSGCGATTATIYNAEEQKLQPDDQAGFLVYHSSGAYVAVWRKQITKYGKVVPILEIEHCLVDEKKMGPRIRLLQKIGASELDLQEISVYKEQWEEPFRSGESVESCLTLHAGFATGPRVQASSLQGNWESVKFSFSAVSAKLPIFISAQSCLNQEKGSVAFNRLSHEESSTIERSSVGGFTLLPEGLWSSLKTVEGGDSLEIEGGWLNDPGKAVVSKCRLSRSGEVESVELATQYRNNKINKSYRTVQI